MTRVSIDGLRQVQSLNQATRIVVRSKMEASLLHRPGMTDRLLRSVAASGVLLLFCATANAQAVDADAAKALIKENECSKCHAVDKEKKGPSYKKIAAKYKGKPDGEEKAIKNMTTGPKVKLDDGTEEEHKVIDTKDPAAIRNVARWILAQ